jgi:Zn-dependent protease
VGRSIQVARIFGIRIGVDASWFLILFLLIWLLSDGYRNVFPGSDTKPFVLATISALLLFVSILLHELGHAWVALRQGMGIISVDLWLLGGFARLKRDAQTAGEEFKVAAAGPAVTLLIALLCLGLLALMEGTGEGFSAAAFEDEAAVSEAGAVLSYLFDVNAALFIFNLIPAFPLDGGRIARAVVWWRTGDRNRATRTAAALGRFFGWLLGAFGVYLLVLEDAFIEGIWLIFIGVFIAQAAKQADLQTAVQERIEGLRVADVMDPEPVAVTNETRLDRALDEFFYRYRWPWFPVTDPAGRFLGLLIREKVDEVPESQRPDRTVDEVMTPEHASSFHVGVDDPLETLLGSDALQRFGALMAVDGDGQLRGVVTLDRVRRALRQSAAPAG